MRRREFLLSTGVAALGLSAFPARWVSAAGTKKKRVLYFTRSQGFEHSVVKRKGHELAHSEQILTDLGKKAGFEVVCSKDGGLFDGDLDQWDAFAFYTTGDLTRPDKQNDPPCRPKASNGCWRRLRPAKALSVFTPPPTRSTVAGRATRTRPNPILTSP